MNEPFKNRIVEAGNVAPGDIKAHPRAWRRHPKAQRAAVQALLDEVGWVGQVTINRRTGRLIDGGLRLELARDSGETTLPVTYVDLSEDEERLMLATLDPVSAMAEADADQWARLVADLAPTGEVLAGLLDDITAGVAGGAIRDLLDPGPDALAVEDAVVSEGSPLVPSR
jgi:hypothetical protein